MPGSTPVVAFGDPLAAEVATLGINPSVREFMERGSLLTGKMRRLATLESLGATSLDRLSDDEVRTVLRECATYFQRRPYRRWFNPLEELLRAGAAASYYDGSACHLDLVQWATDPTWGRIPDAHVRRALLDDGVPHLRAQLARSNVRLILLNGRQVIDQVLANGLADLQEVASLPMGNGACRLYRGIGGGLQWLGWSTNLQSSWGVSGEFKHQLGAWLASMCAPSAEGRVARISIPSGEADAKGYLPRGLRVAGKAALVDVLRRWLAESQAETIGHVGTYGGRPWLLVDMDSHEVALNADTKRAAVEAFVKESGLDPEWPWRVVRTRQGRITKVIPRPEPDPLPGWYAYLTRPLGAEGEI
ncbi:MAG TPA: hypothetical protein VNM43_02880 [Dehalococcoidia bacterium]|nr:hypothetical protein [Dehalococcoidia bacterium]